MEKEILIGSNSDLIVEKIGRELKSVHKHLQISIVKDLTKVKTLVDGQIVIIDLSVYTAGIIDRIEQFKHRFPKIELIAVTYTDDDLIDQMLILRGIDQVTSREELPMIVSKYVCPQLHTPNCSLATESRGIGQIS
ncbi:hypothetical protein SAMN04488029_1016 [Reichenbachiella faecimaris]|uniref:Response regulatory domain-containing protein n=1 Tax=Reichenbachiella faecimaris TaxID=692418 RepID=A0A1W2G8P7_REIFA|nr:hypothetical protein [Reichenbachiella faecimaris]SMD32666.1 hypothetical protein SAMN04488029_1016 [Reichenbachiella faecimaris]